MSQQQTYSDSVERPYGWVVVGVSVLLMAIGSGSLYVSVVALKLIAAEFDWPRSIPSLGYSMGVLGMGFGGMIMGCWSDRAGVTPPALVASVSIPLGAYLVSFNAFLLARDFAFAVSSMTMLVNSNAHLKCQYNYSATTSCTGSSHTSTCNN